MIMSICQWQSEVTVPLTLLRTMKVHGSRKGQDQKSRQTLWPWFPLGHWSPRASSLSGLWWIADLFWIGRLWPEWKPGVAHLPDEGPFQWPKHRSRGGERWKNTSASQPIICKLVWFKSTSDCHSLNPFEKWWIRLAFFSCQAGYSSTWSPGP